MSAEIRLKLKNAESSIAFMQEQHAKTLEGLHKEIQKLQQKNASEISWWRVEGGPVEGCFEICQTRDNMHIFYPHILCVYR